MRWTAPAGYGCSFWTWTAVLTDGGLYYGAGGESLQRFHVHDGAGIKAVMAAGIAVAVISARSTPAVTARE